MFFFNKFKNLSSYRILFGGAVLRSFKTAASCSRSSLDALQVDHISVVVNCFDNLGSIESSEML